MTLENKILQLIYGPMKSLEDLFVLNIVQSDKFNNFLKLQLNRNLGSHFYNHGEYND